MTPLTCEYDQPKIPVDRSTVRDAFFYDSNDRDTLLGGLFTSPRITNDNFYDMIEIVCELDDTFELRDENGRLVERDDERLRPGDYYIVTNGRSLLQVLAVGVKYWSKLGSRWPMQDFLHSGPKISKKENNRSLSCSSHRHLPPCLFQYFTPTASILSSLAALTPNRFHHAH